MQKVLSQSLFDRDTEALLLGKNYTVMGSSDDNSIDKKYEKLVKGSIFSTESANNVSKDLKDGKEGQFYMVEKGELKFVQYKRIPNTPWTLVYQIAYTSVFTKLIPMMLVKNGFYIVLSIIISLLGRKYLKKNLEEVNQLISKVSNMQKEIWQTKNKSYAEILNLTSQGLSDQLTGLATRVVLFDKLSEIDFENKEGAILFIDLDDLKYINDTFGHEKGDISLVHIAEIIKSFTDEHLQIAGRYGEDEFIVLIENVDEMRAIAYARQILDKIKTTIHCEQQSFDMHVSIGISLYPKDGVTKEELISKADRALYNAKMQGKNKVAIYDEIK